MLKPGQTVGIVGGGQLARMLAIAAGRLGLRTIALDPQENAPAFAFTDGKIVAAYDDQKALLRLAAQTDVVTYEFENVAVETLDQLGDETPIHPNTGALATSQDRFAEKTFFNKLGIKTAPWFDIPNPEELQYLLEKAGGKGIVKTRRLGYDGKGQVRVHQAQPDSLIEAKSVATETPCILEGFVDFEREISIIAARGQNGNIEAFDVAENVHREGILRTSTVPANAAEETAVRARQIAAEVLTALDYIGVIGIEFFVDKDGDLLVNEFAPRVHNSGHWTEAACTVSQFEQHIRAVAGLPLGKTTRHSDCVMENLIGNDMDHVPDILKKPLTLLHLYGKAETRDGRKMGHFTTVSAKKG